MSGYPFRVPQQTSFLAQSALGLSDVTAQCAMTLQRAGCLCQLQPERVVGDSSVPERQASPWEFNRTKQAFPGRHQCCRVHQRSFPLPTATALPAMDLGANFTSKLEPFLLMSKSAKGAAAAKLIENATSAPGVFVFAELLDLPNIQEVHEYLLLS